MDDDDFDIDDILQPRKKKRKQSKHKGNRGELALTKILDERFKPLSFSRSLGSGNRWAQVRFVKNDYLGDICCPDSFRFVLECKNGYPEIDIHTALTRGHSTLDAFLAQAEKDGKKAEKPALLCWKKSRQPWLVFVREALLSADQFENCMRYRGWLVLGLDDFLTLDDSFFLV